MNKICNIFIALLVSIFVHLPGSLSADPVGYALNVAQNATVERAGRKSYLQQGQSVQVGDSITTRATGRVQLILQDGTRIAMSANSRIVIDSAASDSSANPGGLTFVALAGSFRFLSGRNEDAKYSIRTKNGTIGFQRSVFDMSVEPRGWTRLLTFRGEAELCDLMHNCTVVRGRCAAAGLSESGRLYVPLTRAEKYAFLAYGFPFLVEQRGLSKELQTQTWGCGGKPIRGLLTTTLGAEVGSSAPGGQPPPFVRNPDIGGAHADNDTRSGLGGSTAQGVDAGDGGPSRPGRAEAGSGGARAGG